MKNLLLLLFVLIPSIAFLQPSKDTSSPYFKQRSYPEIKILLTDSTTIFTKKDIPTDKTVALIFFSPDCEHCQHTAKELITKMDSLSNIFMVWNGPSYLPLTDDKAFYEKYHFANYSNIVMGKEVAYYMPVFYRIEITPYVAIYKNGTFFTEFRNNFKASDLIKVLDENYKPEVIEMVNSEDNKKKQRKNK